MACLPRWKPAAARWTELNPKGFAILQWQPPLTRGGLWCLRLSIAVQSCCVCRDKNIPLRFLIKLQLITLCPTAVLLRTSSTLWGIERICTSALGCWALWTFWPCSFGLADCTLRMKLSALLWSFGFPRAVWAWNPCPCWVPSWFYVLFSSFIKHLIQIPAVQSGSTCLLVKSCQEKNIRLTKAFI